MLISELPVPTCPLKKQQREWKVEQVKKALANKLNNNLPEIKLEEISKEQIEKERNTNYKYFSL